MDRRLTPANKRVADMSMQESWPGVRYVEPTPLTVHWPIVDLMNAPEGHRDRQLLLGDTVDMYEMLDGWAFIRSHKDGYVGYLPQSSLAQTPPATHRITAAASHVYTNPDFRSRDLMRLSHGCLLHVISFEDRFACTPDGYVPTVHLGAVDKRLSDPVAEAELFLDTPYLWGGNSRFGIDCSGLVQAALLSCGQPCPADSDLQEAQLGFELSDGDTIQRGDLLFWKGHVALVVDENRLIHANAHHMAVTYEGIAEAEARILAQGDGQIRSRKRIKMGDPS